MLALKRAEQAVQLRAAGVTISQIARNLGITRRRVQQILDKHLTAAGERIQAHATASLALELERLDAALRVAFSKMNDRETAAETRLKAAKQIVDIGARRAKLLGLDAPEKVAPVNPDGLTPYQGISDEERAAKIIELLAKAQQTQEQA